MILSANVKAWTDTLFSHFRTKVGELRKIRRDIRSEIPLDQARRHELAQYVLDVQRQLEDRVTHDLANANGGALKKGEIILLREQMERIFDALHHSVREASKLLGDLEAQEAEFSRDSGLNDAEREEIVHAINVGIESISLCFNEIVKDLAGFESTTISPFKMLERESQMSEIVGRVLRARRELRSHQKLQKHGIHALKEAERVGAEHHFEHLFDPNDKDHSIDGQLSLVVSELCTVIDELVMALQAVYGDFSALYHSTRGKGLRLAELTSDHAPSITELGQSVHDGGFGLTEQEVAIVRTCADDTEQYFRDELNSLIGEARIFLSKGEHMKLREAA